MNYKETFDYKAKKYGITQNAIDEINKSVEETKQLIKRSKTKKEKLYYANKHNEYIKYVGELAKEKLQELERQIK